MSNTPSTRCRRRVLRLRTTGGRHRVTARPRRVGPVVLSLPAGFTVEQAGAAGLWPRRHGALGAHPGTEQSGCRGWSSCQWRDRISRRCIPTDARRHEDSDRAVDGSAPFDMSRVNGSDTDLAGTIGETQSFIVDARRPKPPSSSRLDSGFLGRRYSLAMIRAMRSTRSLRAASKSSNEIDCRRTTREAL